MDASFRTRRFLIVLLLFSLQNLVAQTVRYSSTLDWQEGTIVTRAEVDIGSFTAPLPAIRQRAEAAARAGLPAHLVTFLSGVPVDAASTIGDAMLHDARILSKIGDFADTGDTIRSFASSDFSRLTLLYQYHIFPDLLKLFITHTRPWSHDPFLGFSPSTKFSGIVIYARGEFPVYGEDGETAHVRPALRPRIFDESMNLLYEAGMVDPEIALNKGIVGYTESTVLRENRDRIGEVPLVTMARALFGTNRTDLIIPTEIATRILANTANRDLLRTGRVLVIFDP